MGRFTIIIEDEDLDLSFRVEAVRRRLRLNKAFAEAMRLWLKKNEKSE
jgi:hypothetical protein